MGKIGAIWGVAGVSALLLFAIVRLSPKALFALQSELTLVQWIALVGFALFMLVAEGYRGFQKKFSPRTAARARYLSQNPRPLHVALAPAFCMGYFFATKKTRIVSISLTLGILILVLLIRLIPDPVWVGIIDTGVVLGLSYGLISFWAFVAKAFTQTNYPHSPEVPASA